MTPDRDQRRLAARAEGRRAAGLGPAIALNAIAGVTALVCGGTLTLMSVQAIARDGDGYDASSVVAGVVASLYLAVAVGQIVAARALSRRHEAHRAARADDRALAKACGAALAVAAFHVLIPLGAALLMAMQESASMGGRPVLDILLMTAITALPAEALPVAALLLTARAWRRLDPAADAALVGPDGTVEPYDAAALLATRRRAILAEVAVWCVTVALVAVAWGLPLGIIWMSVPWRSGGGTAIVLLAVHGGVAFGLVLVGALTWQRRGAPNDEQSEAVRWASVAAWSHAAAIALLVLGLAAVEGGSLFSAAPLLPFAELAPLVAFLRVRRAARDLDRLRPS